MIHPRFRLFSALAAILFLSSCALTPPTKAEIEKEDHQSQLSQIMRVAQTTAGGGDLNSAAGLFSRAHHLAPEQTAPLIGLGQTFLALGSYAQAAQAFSKAVRLEPANAEALYGYGKGLTAMGRPKDAAEQFAAAVQADPADQRFTMVLVWRWTAVEITMLRRTPISTAWKSIPTT